MKRFRIELTGENFLLNLDGEPRKFRFRLKRYLRASDEKMAEKTATIQARQIPALKLGVCNNSEDPPRVHLELIREVNPLIFALRQKSQHFVLQVEEDLI
jgi:hypothetical protein